MEAIEGAAGPAGSGEKDPLCQGAKEPEKRGWECRVGKKGSPGDLDTPTAKRLYDNMVTAKSPIPSSPEKIGEHWDLESCSPTCFPLQSHHLIPKMHLPTHKVKVWLAKKAKNADWELTESTNYDTDDAQNGLSLPFASNTSQWKKAKNDAEKERICNRMMELTGKQLHQGSHTYHEYETGEEDQLHENEETGYLGAVDKRLKMVNGQALGHVQLCPDCKKSATKPVKVRPLERVVAAMHQVSQQMVTVITTHEQFVSERASNYFKSKKK